jgi:hypothetical protein
MTQPTCEKSRPIDSDLLAVLLRKVTPRSSRVIRRWFDRAIRCVYWPKYRIPSAGVGRASVSRWELS